jgi:putative NIF3 family GTP cyclohydrolase 1 type 2
MTAADVVERIKKNLGAPWRDATYRDTYKFGGPDTTVKGIATTAFVTVEVVRRAAAAGLNMVIPHEATFWSDRDDTTLVGGDAVYASKVELMRKHDIVVFRIHDHMHVQRPDFTYVGSARDIGLDSRHETQPGSHLFVIPETTLGALAASVQRHTDAQKQEKALRQVSSEQVHSDRGLCLLPDTGQLSQTREPSDV